MTSVSNSLGSGKSRTTGRIWILAEARQLATGCSIPRAAGWIAIHASTQRQQG